MMSYCAEYQNMAKESSFTIHNDAGWKHVFSSKSALQKWTFWSRQYSNDEEKPRIYSDKETNLKHAKRIARTYSLMFLPMVLMYIYLIGSQLIWMLRGDVEATQMYFINILIYTLVSIMFGSYALSTWLYYRRLKKQFH